MNQSSRLLKKMNWMGKSFIRYRGWLNSNEYKLSANSSEISRSVIGYCFLLRWFFLHISWLILIFLDRDISLSLIFNLYRWIFIINHLNSLLLWFINYRCVFLLQRLLIISSKGWLNLLLIPFVSDCPLVHHLFSSGWLPTWTRLSNSYAFLTLFLTLNLALSVPGVADQRRTQNNECDWQRDC